MDSIRSQLIELNQRLSGVPSRSDIPQGGTTVASVLPGSAPSAPSTTDTSPTTRGRTRSKSSPLSTSTPPGSGRASKRLAPNHQEDVEHHQEDTSQDQSTLDEDIAVATQSGHVVCRSTVSIGDRDFLVLYCIDL